MTPDCGFSFSDLVAGRVVATPAPGVTDLRTAEGAEVRLCLENLTSAEFLRNLGGPYVDASGHVDDLLRPGTLVFAHGVYRAGSRCTELDARRLVFLGRGPSDFRFEDHDWWPTQLDELARFYRRAQFGAGEVDYRDYRTFLRLGGDKTDQHVQETDTISRLVYGFASAFMLTGNEDFLTVAQEGTDYLRDHMRFVDRDEDVVYWYHGIDVDGARENKLFTSVFDDDVDSLPMYEQIYALAGPTQTFRLTGDPRIRSDVEGTLRLFRRFYRDPEHRGYFSHLDPILLDPNHPSLGPNRSRKNWNSIGDHAPAYLFNYFLATGEPALADMLEETFDLIVEHFPADDSPFVQERFHADWSADRTWRWQQDRAVVGHNLKIAWNLMRMYALHPKPEYRKLAEHIARTLPAVGGDLRRGGWYDVVERAPSPDGSHRFVWHDRKAWWQQEQAILAYLTLGAHTGDEEFARRGREAQAFYNAFFLDHDEGGVYFNVLADGTPYLLGNERLKGSHSMSMYHAAELCYLAAVYTALTVRREPLTLWFRPRADADRTLRVAPDALPPGGAVLDAVFVDDRPHQDFDRRAMTVALPDTTQALTVRVRLVPPES